jgi:hypothetical protein
MRMREAFSDSFCGVEPVSQKPLLDAEQQEELSA